jgi:hypothetical protein
MIDPPAVRRRSLLSLLALLPAGCAGAPGEPAGRRPARAAAAAPKPAARPAAAVAPLGATVQVVRRANLRRGPSTREPVLAVLPVGTRLQATGRVEAADWLRVRHGRVEGFVQADLVEPAATGAGADEAALPVEPAAAAGAAEP